MTIAIRSLALLGALGGGMAVAGHAQQAPGATVPQTWIGILTETGALPGDDNPFAVLVTDVFVAGPAHRSGVLPGDVVVAVNGSPLTAYDAWLGVVSDLELGQSLHVGLMRQGIPMEVTITADRRPGTVGSPFDLARLDIVHARVSKRVDSIMQLMVDERPSDSLVFSYMSTSQRLRAAEARFEVSWQFTAEVRDPASVEAARSAAAAGERAREQERKADEMLRLAEESLAPPVDGGGGTLRIGLVRDTAAPPTLTPFILGRPVVLGGAQVRDLSPALGRSHFFGVESGMLVTDVLDMSAAARAGFRAGDVIVAVGGQTVESLTGLRAALAAAVLPVAITIVRRGEMLDLVYPAR